MYLLDSDFVCTLAFHNEIKEEDVKKIHEFQQAGHLFGISTGRNYTGIKRIMDEHNIKLDFYVLVSGSKLMDGQGNILYNHTLDVEIIKEIFEYTHYDCEYAFFLENEMLFYQPLFLDSRRKIITSSNELPDKPYSFLSMHFGPNKEKEAQEACELVSSRYADRVTAYRNTTDVDIVYRGSSKGQSVLEIARYYDIPLENINVIGDSMNDIPMFDITDHAYSFFGIEEDLKPHVNHYVHSVAECIDDLLSKENLDGNQ